MKLSVNRYVIFNLIWITICLITIIFGDDLPIEFASPTMKSISFGTLCIVLPLSIIWTGNQIFHFKSKKWKNKRIISSLVVSSFFFVEERSNFARSSPRCRIQNPIPISSFSLPIIAIALFGRTMCGTTDKIIYSSRTNSSTIVARSFGCGAWDSDFPKYSYYKKTSFLGIFYIKTTVDTSQLNKSYWMKQ